MTTIVLDTDLSMGGVGTEVDDGFALALALADPAFDVGLITTVHGNTDVDSATRLTSRLLEMLHSDPIAVMRGADHALTDCSPGDDRMDAADAIARLVRDSVDPVTVVAIGPLTNIALTLRAHPDLVTEIAEIVIMGGAFTSAITEIEFNVKSDPIAAQTVLESGAKQRWVGLDVTNRTFLDAHDLELLADAGHGFGPFAAKYASAWMESQVRDGELPADRPVCYLHDPLALAVAAHRDLVGWQRANVTVSTGPGPDRGTTVAHTVQGGDDANCEIALTVDTDAFIGYFHDMISQAMSSAVDAD